MPLEQNPQSTPFLAPNWKAFQAAMFNNVAYRRVSEGCGNALLVSRLENFFAVEGETLEIAIQLWAEMFNLCPSSILPTEQEIQV